MGDSCRPMLRPEKIKLWRKFNSIIIGRRDATSHSKLYWRWPKIVASPPLPQGLNLDEGSGMISGTPNKTLIPQYLQSRVLMKLDSRILYLELKFYLLELEN